MRLSPEPAITVLILARNEEKNLPDALASVTGWATQIIVIDHASTDRTAEIARQAGALVLPVPAGTEDEIGFDGLRNVGVAHAVGDWVYVLDADERVTEELRSTLTRLIVERGPEFSAAVIPFKHHFCGKWIQFGGWYPGYCRPQLLKKGSFRYRSRLHSGVDVDGPEIVIPAEDHRLAVVHHTYQDLNQYLRKLNQYTDCEAKAFVEEGATHSWHAQLAHFVHDWQVYYDSGQGRRDGMHGFILAFCSAFYRYMSRAKAWDVRRQQGDWNPNEPVPGSVREMLEFMARVLQEGAQPWLSVKHLPYVTATTDGLQAPAEPVGVIWRAPFFDSSGYASEARELARALLQAGEAVSFAPERWGSQDVGVAEPLAGALREGAVLADARNRDGRNSGHVSTRRAGVSLLRLTVV